MTEDCVTNTLLKLKYIFLFTGITKLRFKPAYNPYTEPSMEVFSYHEGINQIILIKFGPRSFYIFISKNN